MPAAFEPLNKHKCPPSFNEVAGHFSLYGKRVYLPIFTFAHRARCAAAIFFRAAADIVRLLGATATLFTCPLFPFTFAHRAL
jgi:hypothetical protein